MRIIHLSDGSDTIVDDRDYRWLSQWSWCPDKKCGYARRTDHSGPKPKTLMMHREILEAGHKQMVDHVNGNGLDNRRSNLRFCTASENQRNARIRTDNTSGYRGVVFHKASGKWKTRLWTDEGRKYLGLYDTPEAAARVYDEAAKKYHGDYARLNYV